MFRPTLTDEVKKTIDVPDSPASVEIRALKDGEMELIRQDTLDTSSDGEGNMTIGFSLSKRRRAVVEACTVGWSGFTGVQGKALKFNQGNLARMILESTDFVEWVYEEHTKLIEEVESEAEEVEKN